MSNPEVEDEKLIEQLAKQNQEFNLSRIKVLKREKIHRNGRLIEDVCNVVIECDSTESYEKIMLKKKIKHQFEVYNVVDNVYVMRCFKCFGFNHKAGDCKNNLTCPKCAKSHKAEDCIENSKNCTNCIHANEFLKLKLKTNHEAWDRACPIYQNKLDKSRNRLLYRK